MSEALFFPMRIVQFSLIIFFLLGCNRNTLRLAEADLAANNFAGALKTLQTADSTSAVTARLKALALLVEERPVEAFREIAKSRLIDSTGQHATAHIFFRAASAIVREKDRTIEVSALLDSALTLDPGLKDQVINLAWQRGMEYLAMSGDDGYRLMNYAIRHDEDALGRLRGRDMILARRFDEFSAAEQQLPLLQTAAGSFRQQNGRAPSSVEELAAAFPDNPLSGRSGWTYAFIPNGPRIAVEARAKLGNPYGIPAGTLLKLW